MFYIESSCVQTKLKQSTEERQRLLDEKDSLLSDVDALSDSMAQRTRELETQNAALQAKIKELSQVKQFASISHPICPIIISKGCTSCSGSPSALDAAQRFGSEQGVSFIRNPAFNKRCVFEQDDVGLELLLAESQRQLHVAQDSIRTLRAQHSAHVSLMSICVCWA